MESLNDNPDLLKTADLLMIREDAPPRCRLPTRVAAARFIDAAYVGCRLWG